MKVDINALEEYARTIRLRIIETSSKASIPHLGSCLSCVDILTAIYFYKLRIDPETFQKNKKNISVPSVDYENRDRFILSKGHGAPALFQVLAMRGFYPEKWLENYGEDGGLFAEHPPAPQYLPGIEAATGSLGHGLPIGVGMALAARMNKKNYNVYVVLSDGECNEGSIWEAAMFAAAKNINNLCVIIDFNKWQATGRSREVMALDPLKEKWEAFGWQTREVDGHNMEKLIGTLDDFPMNADKPIAIIAHTIKGKGVSFMEDDNNWHYRIPTVEEVAMAKAELFKEIAMA